MKKLTAFFLVLILCMMTFTRIVAQTILPNDEHKSPVFVRQSAMNKPVETENTDFINVYETTPMYSMLGIEEDNIFAEDVWLANAEETDIIKIKTTLSIYSRDLVQTLKLWIFEDLNEPAIYTQEVGQYLTLWGDIMIGLAEPVRVPQHFYVGFSIQGNDTTDYIGMSREVLTGETSEAEYLYGTVADGMLTDTFSPVAPWQHQFMRLEIYTDSINSVIPRFSGHMRSVQVPAQVQFTDLSATSYDDPLTGWAWTFTYPGRIQSYDQNPLANFAFTGIFDVTLKVCTADSEFVHTEKNYIHAYDKNYQALYYNGYFQEWSTIVSTVVDSSLNLTDKFSMEAWIHPDGWGSTRYMDTDLQAGYGKIFATGWNNAFDVFLHKSGDYGYRENSLCISMVHQDGTMSVQNTPENSISLNKWQHIAVTYDAEFNTCLVYIDGIEQTLQSFDDPINGPLIDHLYYEITIGNSYFWNRTFEGRIDEVRLWNHVRSEEEIMNSKNHSISGNTPGLAAYWTFDDESDLSVEDQSGNGHDLRIYSISPVIWTQGMYLQDPVTSINESDIGYPDEFSMMQNYPNPFNPETYISYTLDHSGHVTLSVYDVLGKEIIQLVNKSESRGTHQVIWNGRNANHQQVVSGVYFVRLKLKTMNGQEVHQNHKMIMVK